MIVTHSSQWKKLSEEIHEEAEKSRANVISATGQNSGDQKVLENLDLKYFLLQSIKLLLHPP